MSSNFNLKKISWQAIWAWDHVIILRKSMMLFFKYDFFFQCFLKKARKKKKNLALAGFQIHNAALSYHACATAHLGVCNFKICPITEWAFSKLTKQKECKR